MVKGRLFGRGAVGRKPVQRARNGISIFVIRLYERNFGEGRARIKFGYRIVEIDVHARCGKIYFAVDRHRFAVSVRADIRFADLPALVAARKQELLARAFGRHDGIYANLTAEFTDND